MLLFADRQISRAEGGILFAGIILYTLVNIILARRTNKNDTNPSPNNIELTIKTQWYKSLAMIVLGIGVLVAGSELLVKGAVIIARSLGVGETIIGLTIISAGTSLPELASSIVATIKKEYDIAIGNVIGSNIFNILGIIGVSSLIKPLSAIAISNFDLYAMLGATLLLLPFFRSTYILKRDEGIFMIGIYLVYLYYLWPK
jgi:cation:H+ antiporter